MNFVIWGGLYFRFDGSFVPNIRKSEIHPSPTAAHARASHFLNHWWSSLLRWVYTRRMTCDIVIHSLIFLKLKSHHVLIIHIFSDVSRHASFHQPTVHTTIYFGSAIFLFYQSSVVLDFLETFWRLPVFHHRYIHCSTGTKYAFSDKVYRLFHSPFVQP